MIKKIFLLTTLMLLSFVCANAQNDKYLRMSIPTKATSAAGIQVYSEAMIYDLGVKYRFDFKVKASESTSLQVRVTGTNSKGSTAFKDYTCTKTVGTDWTTASFTTDGTIAIERVTLLLGLFEGDLYMTEMKVTDLSDNTLTFIDECDEYSDWAPSNSKVTVKAVSEAEMSKTAIDKTVSLTVGSVKRQYRLYIPKNLAANPSVVFSLHGANGSMNDNSPFKKEFAETTNVGCVVVYPQGLNQNFPIFGGSVPGWNSTGTVNEDINFFKAILSDLTKQGVTTYDKDRVYICGFSNGGMETYAAASAASDVFAAFASISGFQMNEFHQRLTGYRPVPFMHIHGKNDDFVKYSLQGTIRDNIVARNGCNPVPVVTTSGNVTKSVYSAGVSGSFPYTLYEVAGMGHDAFTTVDGRPSNEAMWYFFKNYTLNSTSDKTLKWSQTPDYADFAAAKHGWAVRKDKSGNVKYIYGEPTPVDNANHNVSHSIQFEKGSYQLRIETEGNSARYMYVKVRKANGEQLFCNRLAVGGKYYIPFTVSEFGEYTIYITKTSPEDKVKSLGFYQTTTAWSGAKESAANDYPEPVLDDIFIDLEQNDDATPKAAMSKVGGLTTFTTVGKSPEVIFKNLNVDVDGFNQVIMYFMDPLDQDYLCAIGSNTTTLKKGQDKFVYDIPAGTVCLSEIALISLNSTASKTVKVAGVALHNTRKTPIEPNLTGTAAFYRLTTNEFKRWTAADATGTVAGTTGCAYELNVSTGMPYGDGNVNYLCYADLSAATKIKVTVTEGIPRLLFNRTVDQGAVGVETPRDPDFQTVVDNGDGTKTYIIDVEKIVERDGFAHLHAIKGANWANVTATDILVDMPTSGEVVEEAILPSSPGGSKFNGGTLYKLPLSQGIGLDSFVRATMTEEGDYVKFVSSADLTVAVKMFDIAVKNCDGVVIEFAEETPDGWQLSLFSQNDNKTVSIPAGKTLYEYKFQGETDAPVIINDVLQQITLLNLWGAKYPLTAKIKGIYLHIPKELDMNGDGLLDISDLSVLVNMAKGTTAQGKNADVNGDGKFNVSDVNKLSDYLLFK